MPIQYLSNEDLPVPEGFTDWGAYWRDKGPTVLGTENARLFLEEKGCTCSRRGRYRLRRRKFADVEPEIRQAVDFLVSLGKASGWTTFIEKEIPPKPKRVRHSKEKRVRLSNKKVRALKEIRPPKEKRIRVRPRKRIREQIPILFTVDIKRETLEVRSIKPRPFPDCEG